MTAHKPMIMKMRVCLLVFLLIAGLIAAGCTESDRIRDQARSAFEDGRYAESVSLYDQAIRISGTDSEL
ncbi:MAG: hypothetical protein GXY18_09180, partial [Methanomicrobiales archaeon]|nr:hypothetical protein [Methanomicrobiales archaeon]